MNRLFALVSILCAALLFSGYTFAFAPKSFTFYGALPSGTGGDYVISWPWSNGMDVYVSHCSVPCAGPASIGAGYPPNPYADCFYITRVVTWNTSGANIMVGKLDVNGYGGDYLTPAYLPGFSDSGWYPERSTPLFKPVDELHIHTTGPGSVAYATIFYTPTSCE